MKFKQFSLAAVSVATAMALTACGGGGGDSGTPSNGNGTPSYGGALTPGSVTMAITNQVTLTTNYGKIVVGLDRTHAPLSTANFLAYVNSGFYTNVLFHRVMPGFVIQAGGYIKSGSTYQYKTPTSSNVSLESRNGLSNKQYTIAMARSSDPNSANSQFYFNLVNNASGLDYPASDNAGYAVFGTVASTDATSIATINAIAAVPTGTNATFSAANWPTTDVVILSAVQDF